jgi:pentalenene oxygenase
MPLMRDPLRFFERLRDGGPVVQIRIGPRRAYVVNRPDLARLVLVGQRHLFDKGGPIIDAVRMVTGNGLAACDARDHDWQRPLVQPAFHHSRFPAYVATMGDCVRGFAWSWAEGRPASVPAEAYRLFSAMTTSTLVSTVEGAGAAAVMGETMPGIMRGAYRRVIVPVPLAHRLPTPANRAYASAQLRLTAAIGQVIERYRAEDYDHGDALSMIMAAQGGPGGHALTDTEVADQIRTVLAGSIETEASLLAWICHLLEANPDAEARLHEELDSVLGDRLAPTYEDLGALAYTRQVVTEAHRLYPPIWMITRVALAATTLGGQDIPAGADVLFSPYALHRIPEIFADPGQFRPERWAPETITPAQREAFLGFGAGHTKCMGDVFGPTAVTVALAALARRWRMRSVSARPPRPVAKITLSPADLVMRAEERRS